LPVIDGALKTNIFISIGSGGGGVGGCSRVRQKKGLQDRLELMELCFKIVFEVTKFTD